MTPMIIITPAGTACFSREEADMLAYTKVFPVRPATHAQDVSLHPSMLPPKGTPPTPASAPVGVVL